jgi:lipopolysaccharide transport system ATP-binding protein
MGDTAIRVEGLGKQYRIGGKQEKYKTLRDTLADIAMAPVRRASELLRGQPTGAAGLDETIWALQDISFEVKKGEVVGIIGRNGAGKSTLLKILTRITEPTAGWAEVYGRVGSLLEVGTGFHPELTGRENVYLNGTILGMKKAEIDSKFDEIVAFSEVEQFLDTPVKHYSSGMYLRLAFAVAAHLEAECLLLDEVLAVGDATFQKKCLGKMGDVTTEGRTVLFVSHNMAAISNLCSRTILLEGGRVKTIADTDTVIHTYLSSFSARSDSPLEIRADREGNGRLRFSDLHIQNQWEEDIVVGLSGQPVRLAIEYQAFGPTELRDVSVSADFLDTFGQRLFTAGTSIAGGDFERIPSEGCFICTIPQLLLIEGQYRIDLWASVNGKVADYIQHAASFEVESADVLGTSTRLVRRKHGLFFVPHSWTVSCSL